MYSLGLITALPFSASEIVDSPAIPSQIEAEVMELFDEFRDPLLRYSLSFGISVHDAEEVIQEVFLSLLRHLQLGRSRSNLRGWLFRVAHNLSLKQRYANKKQQDKFEGDARIMGQQFDPSPNPEECVSSLQRQQRLQAVVFALPEADKRCLHLRAEGLRYRDIATVLGISLGAVSISLARSFARLTRADGR
jgi:RNA polymerase sigma-70 factor, ECF subfamily